jgi:hypothetical protein
VTGRDTRVPSALRPAASSLADFLAALPLATGSVLHGGGSNATVRGFCLDGREYVVKFVRAGSEFVDGHDAATLARKATQLRLIERHCPRLASRYALPLSEYRGADGAAVVFPFVSGQPLADLLDDDATAGSVPALLRRVLTELLEHGYRTRRTRAPSGTFARLHIDRIERRLPVLRRYLPAPLLADGLVVEGEAGLGADELIARLRSRHRLLELLDPPWLYFPVHGDLNLGNVLVRGPDDYTVLDPRGVTSPWDLVYDLAKMQFTLAGLHNAMRSGFAVTVSAGRTGTELRARVRSGQSAVFETMADDFPGLVAALPAFAPFQAADPHWRLRLQMTLAMHALAEAPCRLSDRKPRAMGGRSGLPLRVELAAGLHLMGSVLLARLLRLSDDEARAVDLPRVAWQSGARAEDRQIDVHEHWSRKRYGT